MDINQMFGDKSRMPSELCSILQCSEICTKTFQEVYKFYRHVLSVLKMFFSKIWKIYCVEDGVRRKKTCKLHELLKELPPRFPNVTDLFSIASGVRRKFPWGGFIQWHMLAICIWCAMFVTSQFDVIFMFSSEVCWHNRHILLHALPLSS